VLGVAAARPWIAPSEALNALDFDAYPELLDEDVRLVMAGVAVGGAVQRLAGALFDDVERIARVSVARMQELLPSYAKVPADALIPIVLTNTRNLLRAVCDPDADYTRADQHLRLSGETRLSQGITADEMLRAWRIGLEVVREEAHPIAERLDVTDAVLLEFVEATLQWGDIGMRVSASRHREGEIRELERLAAEQAALRRVATMVARECSPKEVFAEVAEELSRLLEITTVRMVRFEPDGTATLLAARETAEELLPVGTNAPLPRGSVIDQIFRTGEPARVDEYPQIEGPIGDVLRQEGVRRAAGGPIVVDGRLWGAMVVCFSSAEKSSDTEQRVAQFAELVSTAISNVESRAKVAGLAAEQSALRRVATLVARAPASERFFSTVAREVASVLNVPGVIVQRYEADGTVVTFGEAFDSDLAGAERFFAFGTRMPRDPGSLAAQVFETHRAARVDDFSALPGTIGDLARAAGLGSGCAGPIVVNGALWGKMCVFSRVGTVLPVRTENRLHDFIELVATAIANYESRAKVERLAAEQAALRQVAELVARQAPPEQVFALVTEELNSLLDVSMVSTARFEPDGTATVMAARGTAEDRYPPGTNVRLEGGSTIDQVFRTGRPAHVDDYEQVGGQIGTVLLKLGIRRGAAGPIVVDGRLWGAMAVASQRGLPPGTEERVTQFAELVSTAISNIESRAQVERLAAEQSALRRVATLVAREHSADELFATLAEELGVLLEVDAASIFRYEADSSAIVVAGWSGGPIRLPLGERFPLEGENLAGEVRRTGAAQRKEGYSDAPGAIADAVRERGIRSAVASPIVVDGATWGAIGVFSLKQEALPADTEARLAEFSRHAAMAVANTKSRSDLARSRARIVQAGDDARRRFERDLHDGAQQRLVSLGLELRSVEATVPPQLGDLRPRLSRVVTGLNDVLDDLRELSRGLHPAVLSEGGLTPALSSLALLSAVPVELRLDLGAERFGEPVEVAAYYVASEALTNSAKHADASRVGVTARRCDDWLELFVSDDGRGGADASSGSGLTGLVDRVEAIGGTIHIDSRAGLGTAVHVKLPVKSTGS
jgi:GAF domain-containing protein